MSAIYTQEQMIKTRNENYAAGRKDERDSIIKELTEIRDTWQRPAVFNYQAALTQIIERLSKEPK